MAASSEDVGGLVTRLRGQGLSDTEVVEGLRGMGFTKRDAEAAVGGGAGSSSRSRGQGTQSAGGAGESSPDPAGTTDDDSGDGAGVGAGGMGLGSLMPSMPAASTLTLTPPRRLNGGDMAGFFGGLLLYTLALNYLRYGPEGVKGWLSAKFFNRVTVGGLAPGKSGAAGSSSSAGGTSWGQAVLTTKARVPRSTNV